MRSVALPQLALAVRQRADLSGQQNAFGANTLGNVTDLEMTTMLNASVAEVWGVLCRKYGDNYAWGDGGTGTGAGYIIPVVQGTYRYALPSDFWKELGVDLALDSTGVNWASVRPYTQRDRNLFSFPLQTALAYAGWQNVRWQIQGNSPGWLNFLPQVGPLPGQLRLQYYPCAPELVATLPATYATTTVTAQNTLVKANVTTGGVTTAQVFLALNAGTTGGSAPTWNVPGTTLDNGIVWAYQGPASLFQTYFDGINGFEDLVILDCAIKARIKQEQDTQDLMAQKAAWLTRIDAEAANRAAGDPMVVSGGFGMCEGGPAYGNGFGPFGGSW